MAKTMASLQALPSSLLPRARSRALILSLPLPFRTPATQATYPASILSNFQYIVVSFVTWLLRLAWLVCRSVAYYTTLHDWVIKWFQTRWQKWAAFKTHKKCAAGRIFPCGFAARENPSRLPPRLAWRLRRPKSTSGKRIPPATQATRQNTRHASAGGPEESLELYSILWSDWPTSKPKVWRHGNGFAVRVKFADVIFRRERNATGYTSAVRRLKQYLWNSDAKLYNIMLILLLSVYLKHHYFVQLSHLYVTEIFFAL